jgi:hypothetical protein
MAKKDNAAAAAALCSKPDEHIVIIGMSCRVPNANDRDAF